MTTVSFYRQQQPERLPALCQLAAQYHQQGQSILILVEDDNQAVTLDRFLWTWDKSSFIPHVWNNGSVDCYQEPLVISSREENPNGAKLLILGRPAAFDFIARFDKVIDFAELYDAHKAELSRQRFRAYREHNFNPQML